LSWKHNSFKVLQYFFLI